MRTFHKHFGFYTEQTHTHTHTSCLPVLWSLSIDIMI